MTKRLVARCVRVVGTLVLGAAAVFAASGAGAQSPADKYPDKPIKIIVPFAPGGSTDILARVIGQKMTENWGQPVIVETRPGAATVIGTQAAAKAEPDGYTLDHRGEQSHHQSGAQCHDAIRRLEGFRADQPARPRAHRALRASLVSAQGCQGAGRARQGQARDDQFRLRRPCQHDASHGRAVQDPGRHRHDPCGLSRRQPRR